MNLVKHPSGLLSRVNQVPISIIHIPCENREAPGLPSLPTHKGGIYEEPERITANP
jgi:hypothetical protein